MKESFSNRHLDPDQVLGLRDNNDEVNIIPGEVIGGLRGGKEEYFESVEQQMEELAEERHRALVGSIDHFLDLLPVSGMINPAIKAAIGKNALGENLNGHERVVMLSQSIAVLLIYVALVQEYLGAGRPEMVQAALLSKYHVVENQIILNKDSVLGAINNFQTNHPGFGILRDHIVKGVKSIPDTFFEMSKIDSSILNISPGYNA